MGYSILYVEDEINVSKNYSLWLNNYFDEIYEARDGLEAWNIYLEKEPDFLLVDVCIPEINGLDLIRKVRQKDKSIPIVVLSAFSDKEKLLEAIKLNLVEYLIKPVKRSDFKELISSVLDILDDDSKLSFQAGFSWNKSRQKLFKYHEEVQLINSEIQLLNLLANNKNLFFSPEEIYNYIWDDRDKDYNSGSVRNLINKLRKKTYPELIQNSYGRGYFLDS